MTKAPQCHVIVLSLTQAASNDLLPDQIILNGEVQPQQVIRLRNLQPKRGAVELFRLLDVIDRKTIERFALSLLTCVAPLLTISLVASSSDQTLASFSRHARFGRTLRDSDCCLSSILRGVAWRHLSKQKGTGNYGCHIAGFLLGLSQSGKPRASVVGLNQIQTAVDRTGRFHGPMASARKQGGRLEIDRLRSLRLLRPGRVR